MCICMCICMSTFTFVYMNKICIYEKRSRKHFYKICIYGYLCACVTDDHKINIRE